MTLQVVGFYKVRPYSASRPEGIFMRFWPDFVTEPAWGEASGCAGLLQKWRYKTGDDFLLPDQ